MAHVCYNSQNKLLLDAYNAILRCLCIPIILKSMLFNFPKLINNQCVMPKESTDNIMYGMKLLATAVIWFYVLVLQSAF